MKILGQQYDPLIPLVIGTQTASTNIFTGAAPFKELKHGQSIRYWLPYNGASDGNYLKLTLSDGSESDTIAVFYKGTTQLTTHYTAGSLILLTYLEDVDVNGTLRTGWWCANDYYSDTKSTTNSSNTSSKIFLVGATSQGTNKTTYSHDTAYVGTDGCLYSDSTKVSVEGHTHDYSTVYAPLSHTHEYLPLTGGTLTGQLLFSTGTTQSATKGIKWSAINSKNPYIGYATDQTDGTFVVASLLGTNYASGLAIGGGSGNLLWKGVKVLTANDSSSYTLPQATSSELGGVKIGYTESGKNYPVELNSSGQMYVNVPWTDTNTTYDLSKYLPLTGGTISGALTCSSTLNVSGTATMGRIDASNEYLTGSLYVGGKSSTSDGKTGVAFGASGNISMQGASAPALKFFKGTATTSSTSITVDGNSNFLFKVPSMDLLLYSSAMRTSTDNSCYLGAGSYRWKAVYAGTGSIQTSDLNQKKDLVKLLDDERYVRLFDLVEPYAYTFKDGDRRHTGFISQYVEEALERVGLTAKECGFFCKDIKTEPVYNEEGVYIGEHNVLDENGDPVYIYSLRYEEYIAIIGAKLKKLEVEVKTKLKELEDRLKELEV